MKYVELRCCRANVARGKNDRITMEEKSDGTFLKKQNRIGDRINVKRTVYPMEEWDAVLASAIEHGFEVVGEQKREVKLVSKTGDGATEEAPISDQVVRDFVEFLRSYAQHVTHKNFLVKVEDISDEDIAKASDVLKKLASDSNMSVPQFNMLLDRLHLIIPRNIPNVRKTHASVKSEFQAKLIKEQEMFDFIINQINLLRADSGKGAVSNKTILDKMGVELAVATKEEFAKVKAMMGEDGERLSRVFRAKNLNTEKQFDNYCEKYSLGPYAKNPGQVFKTPQGQAVDGVAHLFHGSSTENWWSIFTTGLMLRPENAGIPTCGKAFGHGIYFADLAHKSMGYTSNHSYWRGGEESLGYMAIFKVATGEPYDIYNEGNGVPDNYSQLQEKAGRHADCTWAMAKRSNSVSYLCNEEIIVYTDGSIKTDSQDPAEELAQCTIEYIVEFK